MERVSAFYSVSVSIYDIISLKRDYVLVVKELLE